MRIPLLLHLLFHFISRYAIIVTMTSAMTFTLFLVGVAIESYVLFVLVSARVVQAYGVLDTRIQGFLYVDSQVLGTT